MPARQPPAAIAAPRVRLAHRSGHCVVHSHAADRGVRLAPARHLAAHLLPVSDRRLLEGHVQRQADVQHWSSLVRGRRDVGAIKRGSWAVTGESRCAWTGKNYVDYIARDREKALRGVERCTFGVGTPGGCISIALRSNAGLSGPSRQRDRPWRQSLEHARLHGSLNTLRRHIRAVKACAEK